MSSSLVHTHYGVIVDQKIKTHSTEYVESVKACNEKEEISKGTRTIFILHKACSTTSGTVNKVSPLPSLAAQEANTTEDCPQHPFLNCFAVHTVTGFNRQHHRNRTH